MANNYALKKWIFTMALVLTALFPVSGSAQSKGDLVGTWKLVSITEITDKGEVNRYGLNPTGFLTYTADGRMMAIITKGGRKPLSVLRVSAPASERAEAFSSMTAYAGRYTVDGDKVVHHVEVASIQNFVGTDMVRTLVKLEGKRVTLRTAPFPRGGQLVNEELVWERMN